MTNVIFLLYHGKGHINACLKIARVLKENNYNVTFAVHKFFKPYVEFQGFSCYPLNTVPFGLSFEEWVVSQERKKKVWWHVLKYRWTQRLFINRKAELENMIQVLAPSVVLIDSWQSTDFIVLYPEAKNKRVKLAFVQTMLSTIVNDRNAPLTSSAMPDETTSIRKAVHHFKREKFFKGLRQKFQFLGKDNLRLIREAEKFSTIPGKYISNQKSLFSIVFRNVTEFILVPSIFDFRDHFEEHQKCIGFMVDNNRREIIDKSLESLLTDKSQPLIYCSFGTVQPEERIGLLGFLQKLIAVIKENQYRAIVNCHRDLIPDLHNCRGSNLYLSEEVPQLTVLRHSDAFITHGGLNSIKEAVVHGVPMLVYPTTKNTDQLGNSARILFHKIGLRGEINEDDKDTISIKVKELLRNSTFKENSRRLQNADRLNDVANFLKEFQRLQAID